MVTTIIETFQDMQGVGQWTDDSKHGQKALKEGVLLYYFSLFKIRQ